MDVTILTSNTILYCRKWTETVAFYRDVLELEPLMTSNWFVEFSLGNSSRLSVANEARARIKSAGGKGITLAFEVTDIDSVHLSLETAGASPTPLRKHPWDARVFYVFDPEGNRIEFWEKM